MLLYEEKTVVRFSYKNFDFQK